MTAPNRQGNPYRCADDERKYLIHVSGGRTSSRPSSPPSTTRRPTTTSSAPSRPPSATHP